MLFIQVILVLKSPLLSDMNIFVNTRKKSLFLDKKYPLLLPELFTLNGPNWICHKVYEALSFTHFSLSLVFQDFSLLRPRRKRSMEKGGNYANIPFFA